MNKFYYIAIIFLIFLVSCKENQQESNRFKLLFDSISKTKDIDVKTIEKKLQNILNSTNSNPDMIADTSLGKIFLVLGNNYSDFNEYGKSLEYYRKALEIFSLNNNELLLSRAYLNIGLNYIETNKLDSASYYLNVSKQIKTKINDQKGLGNVSNNLAIMYYWQGKYQESLKEFFSFLNASILSKDTNNITLAYQNIAGLYYTLKDYPEALEFYKKIIRLDSAIGKYNQIPDVMMNIANVYLAQQDTINAKIHYEIARNSALQQNLTNVYLQSSIYLANLLHKTDNQDESKTILQQIENMVVQNQSPLIKIDYMLTKADILATSGYYKEAINILQNLMREFNVDEISFNHKRLILMGLASNFEKINNYKKSLEFWKQFKHYDDSLKLTETQQKMKEFELESKNLIQQQENKILKQDKQQKEATINYLIIIAIIILFSAVLFFILYLQYRKIGRELKTKYLELEELNSKLNALLETKEKFIQIISHDLKNSVNSFKNISKLILNKMEDIPKDKLRLFLTEMNKTAFQTYCLLDNLLNWSISNTYKLEIFSEQFDLEELTNEIINNFQFELEEKNLEINFNWKNEKVIESDFRVISTIMRNLISNAIKFSKPNNKIEIIYDVEENQNGKINKLSIKDYGVGMKQDLIDSILMDNGAYLIKDSKMKIEGSGLGLKLVKHFVEQIGGKIQINSVEGEFTEVSVILGNR